jgi:hypothetical protein
MLLGLYLVSCTLPRRSLEPPVYPHAQDIVQQTFPNDQGQQILFSTTDAPSVVFSFYKDALSVSGWSLLVERPNYLDFGYEVEQYRGYRLSVDVVGTQNGRTMIKVVQHRVEGTDILMPAPRLNP